MLGGNRGGQRLALAHVVFNVLSAVAALALLAPLTGLVRVMAGWAGFADNALLQLALFHTLFNAGGVVALWPWQARLAAALQRWLPDRPDPGVSATSATTAAPVLSRVRARYLSEQALESADAAAAAVAAELRHLGRLSLEVVCQALYLPPDQLEREPADEVWTATPPADTSLDAEALYQSRVKGVYGDLLDFMGRMEIPLDEEHQRFWTRSQLAAMQMVNAVNDAKLLQKNLGQRLRAGPSPLRDAYVALRRHLFGQLQTLYAIGLAAPDTDGTPAALDELERESASFVAGFRQRLFAMVRQHELDGLLAGSLMNDLGHAERIYRSLAGLLAMIEEPLSLRQLRKLAQEALPAGA